MEVRAISRTGSPVDHGFKFKIELNINPVAMMTAQSIFHIRPIETVAAPFGRNEDRFSIRK
ncbi:hypothetical protein ACPOL_6705 [Acidisarcina polymorpha]|uniref:Uncharacterized protein n=1 Tax=Acidisarcina polymorpha TaxID=2211140 RepID=A0A2Z5GAL8_9BACT|nr:hypothetical protein ACPOL_6705 [Acidisarcina polymorpha]